MDIYPIKILPLDTVKASKNSTIHSCYKSFKVIGNFYVINFVPKVFLCLIRHNSGKGI